MIDNKTSRLQLPLPDVDNYLEDDVARLSEAFTTLDGVVATIAEDGKLVQDQVPDYVARLGTDGKLPASVLPSIAINESFSVDTEAAMLALKAEIGDVAIRNDVNKTFILSVLPSSALSSWKELLTTAVSSVNGRTGNVTVAEAGANNDITSLNALSGPMRLGGDASGDYDAVTLRQLRAASGGGGGASMSGVMNNFIGCVEWFNGSRAALPAGYIAADGQEVSQTDAASIDLYTAVNAGLFTSVPEADWQNNPSFRGCYVKQSSTGKFRVPDLNGVQNNSIRSLFLRGSGTGWASGSVGANAAPEISGSFGNPVGGPGGAYLGIANFTGVFKPVFTTSVGTYPTGSGGAANVGVKFSAKESNASYGRADPTGAAATEVVPNSVTGIWIIRANGSFQAANTAWSVINSDATPPAANTEVKGGEVRSVYQVAGAASKVASFKARAAYGGKAMAVIAINDPTTGVTKEMTFDTNGALIAPWMAAMGGMSAYARNTSQWADRGPTITAAMTKNAGDTVKDITFGFRPEWNKTDNKTLGVLELLAYDSSGTNLILNRYWKFNNDGSVSGPGPWVNEASDIRVKKDFKPIENPFDTMRKIRAGTWRMNTEGNDGRFGIGVLANGLYDDYPEAAINAGSQKLASGEVIEDVLTVQAGDSGVLAAVHHAAILELMKTVEDLKAEIKQLRASQ